MHHLQNTQGIALAANVPSRGTQRLFTARAGPNAQMAELGGLEEASENTIIIYRFNILSWCYKPKGHR